MIIHTASSLFESIAVPATSNVEIAKKNFRYATKKGVWKFLLEREAREIQYYDEAQP